MFFKCDQDLDLTYVLRQDAEVIFPRLAQVDLQTILLHFQLFRLFFKLVPSVLVRFNIGLSRLYPLQKA